MDEILNPYQRMALKSVLDSFEQSLQYSSSWVGSWKASIASDPDRPLSVDDCQEAMDLIAAARGEIAALRQALKLDAKAPNPCFRIQAEMMVARANLWDSRSKKLERFGHPAPSLAGILDPSLAHLSDLANKLASTFANACRGGINGRLPGTQTPDRHPVDSLQ